MEELDTVTVELSDSTQKLDPFADVKLREEIESIPDKMAFKIGEVAELLGVKTYVLRYWETEFDVLKPKKSSHNQRMYSKKDVETAFCIRKLLHRDRFSIEGARKALKRNKKAAKTIQVSAQQGEVFNEALSEVRALVEDIQSLKSLF